MLTRLVMIVVVLALLVTFLNIPKQDRQAYIKRYWPILALLALFVLALSKSVSWLAPLIGLVTMGLQYCLKYIAQRHFTSNTKTSGNQTRPPQNNPSIDRAMNLFGFTQKPKTRKSVIARHRKLMTKHHPDKGGDPSLAGDINNARDILLGLFD